MLDLINQPRTGPFLDRLFSFRLPDGRLVAARSFRVLPAHLGLMEGGLDADSSARKRDQFVAHVEAQLGSPVVVVEPSITPLPEISTPRRPRERLPWMACAAQLISDPIDPEMTFSWLTLVWWQDAFETPLPQEIERTAAGLAWEASARDFDF
jgi:hypothetical protein